MENLIKVNLTKDELNLILETLIDIEQKTIWEGNNGILKQNEAGLKLDSIIALKGKIYELLFF